MMRPDWIMAVAIILALGVAVFLFTFVSAVVLLDEGDESPGDTLCAEGCALCDAERARRVWDAERAFASADDDELGDGSDEGLVRVAPDVLLRQTLAARKEA